MKQSLWSSNTLGDWKAALESYTAVVARQGVAALAELDRWYREELPDAPYYTGAEGRRHFFRNLWPVWPGP